MNINLKNLLNQNNVLNKSELIEKLLNFKENQSVDLKQLLTGQTFSGYILDIHQRDIQIMISENQIFNARLVDKFDFNIGDKITFEIKENSSSQVIIKPIENNEISDTLINKALNNANIQVNNKNVDIVKNLIYQNMPIDKETILYTLRNSVNFPQADIKQLICMQSLGIEVNEKTISQFNQYIEGQLSIVNELNIINDKLYNMLSNLTNLNKIQEAVEFNKEINEVFYIPEKVNQEATMVNKCIENNIYEKNDNNQAKQSNEYNFELVTNNTIKYKKDELIELINNLFKPEYEKDKNTFIPEHIEKILYPLLDDTEEVEGKLIKIINNILEKPINSNNSNAIKELFNSAVYKEIFKEQINNHLYINPLNFNEEENKTEYIKNTYQNIEKTMEKLLKLFTQIEEKDLSIVNSCRNVSNNINFIESLNHIFPYVQFPLKLIDHNGHGELYVYQRNTKKTSIEESLTAFLHLDLEYLGATDVDIKMQGKKVTTAFSLQDKTSINLVENHLPELKEKLEKRGYNVEYSVTTMITDNNNNNQNIINRILDNKGPKVSVKRYSFDVKC